MNINQFLAKLNKFAGPKTFYLKKGQLIRSVKGDYCPINYLAKRLGKNPDNFKDTLYGTSQSLKLDEVTIDIIADAADYNDSTTRRRKQVRKALLKFCKQES